MLLLLNITSYKERLAFFQLCVSLLTIGLRDNTENVFPNMMHTFEQCLEQFLFVLSAFYIGFRVASVRHYFHLLCYLPNE